jgi:hypothetical protein
MATPSAAPNADRIMRRIIAILFQPAYAGSAREVEQPVGRATVNRTRTKVWISAGVPAAGENVADGDVCLDTTNDDVYRYYDSAWDKLNVTT